MHDNEVAATTDTLFIGFAKVIGVMMSRRSAIGWVYGAHTGEDLFFYAYGPNHPTGLIENTQVATISARSLGFDLDAVDRQLFVPADTLAKILGASVTLYSDSQNSVLIIQKTFNWAEIPINTNILKIGKDTYELPGIAVLIPQTGKVYIPQQAVELLKAAGM